MSSLPYTTLDVVLERNNYNICYSITEKSINNYFRPLLFGALTVSLHLYNLLEEIEKIARKNLLETRSVHANVGDPQLSHYIQLLEAHSFLSIGISRLIADYLVLITSNPTTAYRVTEQRDLELIIRLLTELLAREEKLIRKLNELSESLPRGLAKKIVAAWLSYEMELVEELSKLRSHIFAELKTTQERVRPEAFIEE